MRDHAKLEILIHLTNPAATWCCLGLKSSRLLKNCSCDTGLGNQLLFHADAFVAISGSAANTTTIPEPWAIDVVSTTYNNFLAATLRLKAGNGDMLPDLELLNLDRSAHRGAASYGDSLMKVMEKNSCISSFSRHCF